MDKLLKPYDKEYMKMAMLQHEETFREQVYELHRLYRIQKMLMKNIATIDYHHDRHQKPQQIKLDLELPADHEDVESDGDGLLEMEDESDIQLTLGPTSYNRRNRKTDETPLNSDSGLSFSSSSSGSNYIKRTSLGTHQRRETNTIREEESFRHKWGKGRKNGSDVEEQLGQDRVNQHPWIFQVFSLKMT
ncbi:unnamed protein product [Ilex paraguariensis]